MPRTTRASESESGVSTSTSGLTASHDQSGFSDDIEIRIPSTSVRRRFLSNSRPSNGDHALPKYLHIQRLASNFCALRLFYIMGIYGFLGDSGTGGETHRKRRQEYYAIRLESVRAIYPGAIEGRAPLYGRCVHCNQQAVPPFAISQAYGKPL